MDEDVENHRAMPPKVPTPRYSFTPEEHKKSKLNPNEETDNFNLVDPSAANKSSTVATFRAHRDTKKGNRTYLNSSRH